MHAHEADIIKNFTIWSDEIITDLNIVVKYKADVSQISSTLVCNCFAWLRTSPLVVFSSLVLSICSYAHYLISILINNYEVELFKEMGGAFCIFIIFQR